MVPSKLSLSATVAAALALSVNGHGYMSVPKVEFTINGDFTQFIGTIESSASGLTGTFNADPASNTAAFTKAFGSSEYKSLKEFVTDKMTTISGATKECGLSNPDETPQPLPDTYVEWAHSSNEGFTPSHEGPCEIWCDETRVFQDDDCAAHFTTAPAQLAYDRASCLGSSRLTFYWLALHSSTWQVYVNCAALEGSTGSTPSSSSAAGSTGDEASSPVATTASPAATTSAPAATTSAPAATPAAPASTTAAPATSKCNARLRK
jgi:hypothetical protein